MFNAGSAVRTGQSFKVNSNVSSRSSISVGHDRLMEAFASLNDDTPELLRGAPPNDRVKVSPKAGGPSGSNEPVDLSFSITVKRPTICVNI